MAERRKMGKGPVPALGQYGQSGSFTLERVGAAPGRCDRVTRTKIRTSQMENQRERKAGREGVEGRGAVKT